jgi:hypothetical protein
MVDTESEFDKFDAVVGKVFSVPRSEILKREKEYQRKRMRLRKKRTMAKRNLGFGLNTTQQTAQAWCGGCSWRIELSNWPTYQRRQTQEVQDQFDAHKCADYPKGEKRTKTSPASRASSGS